MIISNIQTVVSINSRKLLSSGVVHVEGELPIKIQIANLRFAFKFAKDDGESRYSGEVSGDELLFTLYNHGNSLGEGFFSPIPVATIEGQNLSFTYFVNTLDAQKGSRRFEYAFYLEGE